MRQQKSKSCEISTDATKEKAEADPATATATLQQVGIHPFSIFDYFGEDLVVEHAVICTPS